MRIISKSIKDKNYIGVYFYKQSSQYPYPYASYKVNKELLIEKKTLNGYTYYLVNETKLALVMLTSNELFDSTTLNAIKYLNEAINKKYFILPNGQFMRSSSAQYLEIQAANN